MTRGVGVLEHVNHEVDRRSVPPVSDELSRVFSALADPTRREIVARLAVGDATVMELAAPFDVSKQAVSKHLRVLESAGLVAQAREGRRRLYRLERGGFDSAREGLEAFWTEALPALAQVAEASWEAKSR